MINSNPMEIECPKCGCNDGTKVFLKKIKGKEMIVCKKCGAISDPNEAPQEEQDDMPEGNLPTE